MQKSKINSKWNIYKKCRPSIAHWFLGIWVTRGVWDSLINPFCHFSTLCSIPLRLMIKSLVLVSKGTISTALARSLECCCSVDSKLASPWLWLALVLCSSVSMNSWRAASQFSWKVLKEVFSYIISPQACISTHSFSPRTQVRAPFTEI